MLLRVNPIVLLGLIIVSVLTTGVLASALSGGGGTASNVVVYNVIAVVDKTDARLLPAMTATVNIIVEQQDNVILIPTSAISYARTQGAARGAAATASPTAGGQGQGRGQGQDRA